MTQTKVTLWLTLALIGLSAWFLWPTVDWWYLHTPQERSEKENFKDPLIAKILNLGLDLRGGTHLLLEVDQTKLDPKIKLQDAVDRAIEIIRNRVDQFGVAEPMITRQGDKWIVIQLPGIKNPERAKELIGKTAQLEFRLVKESDFISDLQKRLVDKKLSMEDFLAQLKAGSAAPELVKLIPAGVEILPMRGDDEGRRSGYVVTKAEPELTGATLVDAKVNFGGQNNFGMPTVGIEFNAEGAQRFASVTEANIGKQLAIVLDGIVQSAPEIKSAIPDGHAVISGQFTSEDATFLKTVLRAGALPAPVKIIEERTVGPTLGSDSIKAGVRSSIIAIVLVMLFMFVIYRTSGIIADLAMLINMIFIFGVMASMHATLTLPGIAGTILSLAMAVDANVLILERVREEHMRGKTVRLAIDLGYKHAWPAILDGHVTTLISAGLLFQFGTGPIKGFAVTLFWGVLISIFTAVYMTHMIYDLWLSNSKVESLNY